mgnify:CR=1 FL=1
MTIYDLFRHGHGTLQAVTNNLEVVLDLLVRKVVTLAFFNDTEFNLALKLLFIQRGASSATVTTPRVAAAR